MTNTAADLRKEVVNRLRDTLHGRTIDTMEKGMPETPHMLGVAEIGTISTRESEKGTILDPKHEFWHSYYKDVNTRNAVRHEVETSMKSLNEDDVFRVTCPYGDDAGIAYVEVERINEDNEGITTICEECGQSIPTKPTIEIDYGIYNINFNLDCPSCEFEEKIGQKLVRQ